LELNLPKFESVFSIDCVIFGFEAGELKILLIERNEDPYKDWLALPGYIVSRMKALTMLPNVFYTKLPACAACTWNSFTPLARLNRHPQGRVVTVAYYALLRLNGQKELKPINTDSQKSILAPGKRFA
jgi:8-oxo-dGTP diphosphatase